jgi:hypothetical protein
LPELRHPVAAAFSMAEPSPQYPTPEQLELRLTAIETDISSLKQGQRNNRIELGANSRASLTFVGGVIIMLMIGSRFADGQYSYQVELEHLTTLIGLPAIASILAALIPAKK